MNTLDMRGFPCPIPIIRAKKELEQADSDGVIVLADNMETVQNLKKMSDGLGYEFSYTQRDENGFEATISKRGDTAVPEPETHIPVPKTEIKTAPSVQDGERVIVLITGDQIGAGCEELGKILIKGFLFSLSELSVPPTAIIFMNSGVRLAVEGSNAVEDLRTLVKKGTKVLACGTCLNYYKLTEKLSVGEVTDMFSITGYLVSAARLITL